METAAANTVDFSGFITALTSTITVADVLLILSSVVGVGIVFFLMWLGVRKAISSFTSAVSKGKLKI